MLSSLQERILNCTRGARFALPIPLDVSPVGAFARPRRFLKRSGFKGVLLSLLTALLIANQAEAVFTQLFEVSGSTNPDDGSLPIAGKASFTFQSGKLTLQLTNVTVDPTKPSQLLTGFSFHLADPDGTITNLSLQSAKTFARTVNSNGSYTDSGQQVDLLALNTWMMGDTEPLSQTVPYNPFQGIYNVTFHPDASYGIIGSPGADQKYMSYQQSGLSPFAAESVTFVFTSNRIDGNTKADDVRFFFGTDFQASPIPETSTVVPLAGILAMALGTECFRRRRRGESNALSLAR